MPQATVLCAVLVLVACGGARGPVAPTAAPPPSADARPGVSFTFDADPVGVAPAGFTAAILGPGGPANWVVETATDAPSAPHVLVQRSSVDLSRRFVLLLKDGLAMTDGRVEVRAQAISGGRDRSFGVVARAVDERTYYCARCNTSEWGSNVRIYRFSDGARSELAAWDGDAQPGAWHELALEVRGDRLSAVFNGVTVLTVSDAAIPGPGRVGLWTKAEAVSAFDNLRIVSGSAP